MSLRVAVDTGGTFTDLVLQDGPRPLRTHKRLSTPDDPARAVLEGIAALLDGAELRPEVVHGSTVATNALLEGRGGVAAFVTNEGLEDTLHIGRQHRPALYARVPRRDPAPIPRERSLGLPGRLAWDGAELRPLPDDALDALVERLRALQVEAVAVSLLHSYANPAHEARVAASLRAALPEVHLTVSCELLPEPREFERGATCAANAVVAPRMSAYLGRLEAALGAERLRVMGSAGGSLTAAQVRAFPVHTVLSGPAGGVVGALALARAARPGPARLITFDMGGTSTDVSLCNDSLTVTGEGSLGDWPIRVPLLDIHTVGAGGGSVAWVDAGGALRVGPRSCGADPGPACYGRQRAPWLPTVTDANVVLGRLPADRLLGGALRLDVEAARAALGSLAGPLGMTVEDTARGILRVAEAVMVRAIKVISVQRGHDPRGFALACFGGAGGLHACQLAAELGISEVFVPRHPGLLSAVGMLLAPASWTGSRALLLRLRGDQGAPPPLLEALEALRGEAVARMEAEGFGESRRALTFTAALRYQGQSHALDIALDPSQPERLAPDFAAEHQRLYEHHDPDRDLELVTLRVHAHGFTQAPAAHRIFGRATGLEAPWTPWRAAFGAEPQEGRLYDREALRDGDHLPGPCLITEYSATTLVPEGWSARPDAQGHLHLRRHQERP